LNSYNQVFLIETISKLKVYLRIYNKRWSAGAQAAQARALREHLRGASETIILGILDHFKF
jgi:hypothetical protein